MKKVVGITDLKDMTIYIASDEKPFITSSYYIVEDINTNENIPVEVIETMVLPFIDKDLLPSGVSVNSMCKLKFNEDDLIYLAKVKILKNLYQPLIPGSNVRPARFEEVKNIMTNSDPNDSMILGVIKGTEAIYNELPDNLSNIAPLWKDGKAINQNAVPLLLNYHAFREYPNIGIFGGAGSGKSFALKTICEELMKLNIPAIVFDPHNELRFEGVMDGLDDKFKTDFTSKYNEFQIGNNIGIKFTDLNISELINLFNYVGGLTEPQRNALENLYEKGDTKEFLQEKVTALKNAIDYMDNLKAKNYKGKKEELVNPLESELYYKFKDKVSGSTTLQALAWKLSGLINTNIFVCDTNAVKETLLFGKVAIIRGDMTRLQMLSSYLMNKMYQTRRAYVEKENYVNSDGDEDIDGSYFPPFFTIIDEAHNFAPQDGYSATKILLRKMAQEARKFGVFLIVCTQRPKILDTTLVAQLSTKFIFRLTDQHDIEVARTEGNLTLAQASMLPEFKSGNCFATSPILNKTYPVLFRTTFTKAGSAKDPFVEMSKKIKANISTDIISEIILESAPFATNNLAHISSKISQSIGKSISIITLKQKISILCNNGKLKEEQKGLIKEYTLIN